MQLLSEAERTQYTCRDIDLELAKVSRFRAQMADMERIEPLLAEESFVGGFGSGSASTIHRNYTERTAARREAQLEDLRIEKQCGT